MLATTTQNPVPVPEPKTKDQKLTAIFSLLILVLLISTVYLGYQNFMLRNEIKNLQTQASPVPTPTPDETANSSRDEVLRDWKTYTNTKYGFKIRYPDSFPDFKTKTVSSSDKPFYTIREIFTTEIPNEYGIEIATWDNPSKSTLKVWLESMQNAQALALPIENFDLTPNSAVNGKEALRFWLDPVSKGQEPGKFGPSNPMNEIYIANNDKIYRILFGFSKEVGNEDIKTLDQILSTFKFLEDIESSPSPTSTSTKNLSYKLPSGWSTATDKGNTFSVGYDPVKYNALIYDLRIDLAAKSPGISSFFIKNLPYDGGSRHEFIRKNIGATSLVALKTKNTIEINYTITGKNSLFLYNMDLSGSCSIGMVGINENSALLIESQFCTAEFIEPILITLKFTE